VSTHGFALNVKPDLSYFNGIVPCGITDRPVTSLQAIMGGEVDMDAALDAVERAFAAEFQCELRAIALDSLLI
jgi:lipoyl(octanoyl) transferase